MIKSNLKEGHYCLENKENIPMVFDVQMTTNREFHLVYAPLFPGKIRRHFLVQNEFAIFYGINPQNDAIEVNLNLKSLRDFPQIYFDNCTKFPNFSYKPKSFKNLINLWSSNMMTVYSFYINESSRYKEFDSIFSFQPLMNIYCSEGGKVDNLYNNSFFKFDTTFSQYLLKGKDAKYKFRKPN